VVLRGDIIFHQFLSEEEEEEEEEVFPLPHFTSGRPRVERRYLQEKEALRQREQHSCDSCLDQRINTENIFLFIFIVC